ncbi:MAG: aspartate/glutamate racemase family protein [Clostridia bacterium]|nr:aspartate/glutamate racemase family protein [Clostridia bacterium]
MIGVFDSGLGGLCALYEIHRLLPRESTVFLADRENAPYGERSESELIRLVSRDTERLALSGADRILVGCCTACTVLDKIPRELSELCTSIIEPTVREALSLTATGRIAVLCTEATKRSRIYERTVLSIMPSAEAVTYAAGGLVRLVEGGMSDAGIDDGGRKRLSSVLSGLNLAGCDTLILGCTHFSHLERTLGDMLSIRTVSAARAGAEYFSKIIMKKSRGS